LLAASVMNIRVCVFAWLHLLNKSRLDIVKGVHFKPYHFNVVISLPRAENYSQIGSRPFWWSLEFWPYWTSRFYYNDQTNLQSRLPKGKGIDCGEQRGAFSQLDSNPESRDWHKSQNRDLGVTKNCSNSTFL